MDGPVGDSGSPGKPSDERDPSEMLARARTGDTAAFEELLRYYRRQIWNLIARVILPSGGTREDVEEVEQNTWIAAWRGLPRVSGELRFEPWIRRIAVNEAINNIRQRKRAEFDQLPDDETLGEQDIVRWASLGASSMIKHEELLCENECIMRALAKLSLQVRVCLILFHVWGYSLKEIAEILSQHTGNPIQPETVGAYLSRGRGQFREAYKQVTGQTGGEHE